MSHGAEKMSVIENVKEHNVAFLVAFVFVFVATLILLSFVGIVPAPKPATVEDLMLNQNGNTNGTSRTLQEPMRIVAQSIGLDEQVQNPQSSDISVLDAALLKGAVRYPGSAYLGEAEGNVLLFGHSSYLLTVYNDAYRAFNNIQKLKTGEIVKVYSQTDVYEYRVTSVRFVTAEEGVVDLSKGARRLTLVTCNSFGSKSDRFMVEAEFVGSYPLGQ